MLTIFIFAALVWVTWKLFVMGLKLTWGIAKFACAILFFPLLLLGLSFIGMLYLAISILVIGGIVLLIRGIAI